MRLLALIRTGTLCWCLLLFTLAPSPDVRAEDSVILQLRWDHQFQFAGYYAALWQGFYEEAGLAVEIRSALTPDGRILSAVEEVHAGRADFGIGAADILMANDKNSGLSVVAGVFQQSAARFFLKQETPFAVLADLTRLRVARRVNDLIDVELQAMLLKEEIDPQLVPAHDHQPGFAHLLDDRVQVLPGYLTSTPYHSDHSGRPFKQIRPIDYGVDFYGDSLFTRTALTRKQADLVERFVAASLLGWRHALDHAGEMATRISGELERVDTLSDPLAFNRFQIPAVRELTLHPFVQLGNINPHRWQAMHSLMRELGLLQNDLDLERFIFDPQRLAAERGARYRSLIGWGLALFSFLAVMGFLFVRSLKFQVEQRTEEIRQERNRFQSLTTNAPNVIFATDQDLRVTYINRVIDPSSPPEDIIGRHVVDLTPVDQVDAVLKRVEAVRTSGQPTQYESVSKAEFGDFWLDVRLGPLMQDDTVTGFIFILTDITERKTAEVALSSAHERLLAVLNSIDATIYVADMETHEVLFMNKFMIESFGRDCTGEICWQAFRGEPAPCGFCTNDKLLDAAGQPAGVCTWQDQNPITGRYYINKDRAIQWADGRMVRLQIATDITDLKQMEEELRQAHKMEAIGTLAGGVAHDFNNILSSILGFTELAMDDIEKGSPTEDNLQEVFAAGMRAKELVKQILTFARQSDDELKPIRIETAAREALKLIRPSTPSTIDIHRDIDTSATVMGNVVHIHQILMNLSTNAVHSMEAEGGRLTIKVRDVRVDSGHALAAQEMAPGDYVEIQVADEGGGIPPSQLDNIFEPYFTTKAVGEGTGMGLAVVHGIVESYGGKITVESTVGEGTTFRLYLPATRKRTTRQDQQAETLPTGTERVLFVDDEVAIAKLGGQTLSRLGYRVTVRTSSVEALELFRADPQRFDLVVTDMTMPGMTGDSLAGHLIDIRPDIPIILCTGYSKQMTETRAYDIGIRAFAFKPLVKAELAKTVRQVLDAHDVKRQLEPQRAN